MNTLIITTLLLITKTLAAQTWPHLLTQKEREMAKLAYRIVNDTTEHGRIDAVMRFIPALVEALKVRGSFEYPFDSLRSYVSILTPPDKSFRIFTWQLHFDNGSYRYFGAIQKNNADKLELHPLFDFTDSLLANETIDLKNVILDNKHWKGAVYYNIITKKVKNNTYYFLIGWDGHDLWSNKKLIEPLHFDQSGTPVFGAPLFEMPGKVLWHRFILEYRDDAYVTLNYSEADKMIVFDHLTAPENRLSDLQFTFIPDGSYCGLKWKKNKWKYIDQLKTKSVGKPNSPPLPKPIDFKKEKEQWQYKKIN